MGRRYVYNDSAVVAVLRAAGNSEHYVADRLAARVNVCQSNRGLILDDMQIYTCSLRGGLRGRLRREEVRLAGLGGEGRWLNRAFGSSCVVPE